MYFLSLIDSFLSKIFTILTCIDEFFWSYIGFSIIIAFGLYFTIKTKGFQFSILRHPVRVVRALMGTGKNQAGTNPLALYFASIGGSVGLGNVVAVVTVLTIGGPGGIFWLWVAAFAGMLIKYCEIYLGITHRVKNQRGGYDGGPMYYLSHAFGVRWLPLLVAFLLCIYGVEVSQFLILTDTFTDAFGVDRHWVILVLLGLVFYGGLGGVSRLAKICSIMMPPFLIAYIGMCSWVIIDQWDVFMQYAPSILSSAFSGHAAIGGFAGSSFIMAAQYGTSRAVYSGDIGIGYDAIIQSETRVQQAAQQARLAIFSLFNDTIICTLSCLVVLVSGLWCAENITFKPSEYVAHALSAYFPNVEWVMAGVFFLVGFTTIMAYFVVGLKAARFISPRLGERIYLIYAFFAFIFFSYYDQTQVMLLMSVSGGLLMLCNLSGIWKLRNEIPFDKIK